METNCLNRNPQEVKPALTNEIFMPKDKKPTGPNDLNPKQIAKKETARMRAEFGRHLHKLMLDKRLRQADLSRLSGIMRDSISQYVNGHTLPIEANAEKLAKALGVSVAEIYPADIRRQSFESDEPPKLKLTQDPNDPSKCFLILNQSMSFSTATKIIALIEGADKD